MIARILLVAMLAKAHGFRAQLGGAGGFRSPSGTGTVGHPPFLTAFVTGLSECTNGAYTTTQGGAITVSRAATKLCQKSDGTLVSIDNDKASVEGDGLYIEDASTNLIDYSEDLFNNGGVADEQNAAFVAGNIADPYPGDSVDTADQVTSTVAGGYIGTDFGTVNSTTAVASVFVRSVSGTQSYAISMFDGTDNTTTVCAATGTATTSWPLQKSRLYCTGTTTSGHVYEIRLYPGGLSGTGSVYAWGFQIEAGRTTPSSYINTALNASATTRAGDAVSVSLGSSINTAGCVAADTTFLVATANARLFSSTATPLRIKDHTHAEANDSTNTVTGPAGELNALTTRLASAWSSSTMYVYSGSLTATSGTFDGSMANSTLNLGSAGGSANFLDGWMKNIKVGTSLTACE